MSIAEILHERFVAYFMRKGNLKKLDKKDELAIKIVFLTLPTIISVTIKATLYGLVYNWVLTHKGFNSMVLAIAITLIIKLDLWFSSLRKTNK